jgi:ATP-dependent helicase/nuclease subunit A
MKFGSEVHSAFEQVGWIDETLPTLPDGEAGSLVASLLATPRIRSLFERKERSVELFREQPVDAVFKDQWLSGIMDRLHIHRDSQGVVSRVEIIDFKTDAIDEISELAARYSSQMDAYRKMMATAYPDAEIECILLSTRFCDCLSI